MYEALRLIAHKREITNERLKKGVNPHQPLPPQKPQLEIDKIVIKDRVQIESLAQFTKELERITELLMDHQAISTQELLWQMRYLLQVTRGDSLLSSRKNLTSEKSLFLPSFGLALSPAKSFRALDLKGVQIRVGAKEHSLPKIIVDMAAGDPLGVIEDKSNASFIMTLPMEKRIDFVFIPYYPVVDLSLRVNGQEYRPMKTRRGCYFWVNKTTKNLTFTINLQGQTCLIAAPLLGQGEWTDSGEMILTSGGHLGAIRINGASSGAIIEARDTNISSWKQMQINKPMADLQVIARSIGGFSGNNKTIDAGWIPRRIYEGANSWHQETGILNSLNKLVVSSSNYLPLKAAIFTVGTDESVRLLTYAVSAKEITISVTLPGIVKVNGIEQAIGQVIILAGDNQIEVLVSDEGTHRFHLPIPADVRVRARYNAVPFTLDGQVATIENAQSIPYEFELIKIARQNLIIKVNLPVRNGQPAAVADLNI
jgi:hypothetical protein